MTICKTVTELIPGEENPIKQCWSWELGRTLLHLERKEHKNVFVWCKVTISRVSSKTCFSLSPSSSLWPLPSQNLPVSHEPSFPSKQTSLLLCTPPATPTQIQALLIKFEVYFCFLLDFLFFVFSLLPSFIIKVAVSSWATHTVRY